MEQLDFNEKTGKQKFLDVLRWIVALPASVLGCVIAYWIVVILNRLTITRHVAPYSFMERVFEQGIGHATMGAAFVYISVCIVPSYKKQTGIVIAGIALLFSGASLLAAIMTRNYWAIFGVVCMNVGSIGVAHDVFKHETQKETDDSVQQDAGHISEGTRLGNIIVFVGRSLTLDAPSDFEKKLCVV